MIAVALVGEGVALATADRGPQIGPADHGNEAPDVPDGPRHEVLSGRYGEDWAQDPHASSMPASTGRRVPCFLITACRAWRGFAPGATVVEAEASRQRRNPTGRGRWAPAGTIGVGKDVGTRHGHG